MGGGGSGGGTGVPAVDRWPEYIKTLHSGLLNAWGWGGLSNELCLTSLITEAASKSPYGKYQIPAASSIFGNINTPAFDQLYKYASLDFYSLWDKMAMRVAYGNYFQDTLQVVSQMIHDDVEENSLAEFRAGMRNINAVQSSSFIIGEALIHGTAVKAITKAAAEIQTTLIQLTANMLSAQINWYKDVVLTTTEVSRINLAYASDKAKFDQDSYASDSLWKLELTKYLMQGISIYNGIGPMGESRKPSQSGSALAGGLSGALSGAAMGAPMGPWGAGIGAVVGGIAGAFSK